jgi:superfamily I DNA/RNA helicase
MAIDYQDFVDRPRSLLIAPAGFGKTHSIAECLKRVQGKQLVLTHTHAGIAALKDKIKKQNIRNCDFQVETITSYAQKYVTAFYCGDDSPKQRDTRNYYPFIIEKATNLVGLKPISDVVRKSYSGIFVDEYQDCSIAQHKLINQLANILPTRIFGDPLQGIFDFNREPMVDLNAENIMGDFIENKFQLDEPWRWKNSGNEGLGRDLSDIRSKLERGEKIDLRNYSAIEVLRIPEANLYTQESKYREQIWKLLKVDNLLIMHPESSSINPRLKIIKLFANSLKLLESIDDQDFYVISEMLDAVNVENVEEIIAAIARQLFNKIVIDEWFNEKGLKNKKTPGAQLISQELKKGFDVFKASTSPHFIANIFEGLKKLPNIRCYRRELLHSLNHALREATVENISVTDAMINTRNYIRRTGRAVTGKSIGTTLLTKGLEFDTVAILNAHKFQCPKNFYVAITRACRRLVVFTENLIISPYPLAGVRE